VYSLEWKNIWSFTIFLDDNVDIAADKASILSNAIKGCDMKIMKQLVDQGIDIQTGGGTASLRARQYLWDAVVFLIYNMAVVLVEKLVQLTTAFKVAI
jgi:hypothetical protein